MIRRARDDDDALAIVNEGAVIALGISATACTGGNTFTGTGINQSFDLNVDGLLKICRHYGHNDYFYIQSTPLNPIKTGLFDL